MLNTPFQPWPSFTNEEADAIRRVLLSNRVNYWTGTECREFEKEFARWCGSRTAIALTNGTVALELAMRALEIGEGHEVIVTPRTFLASASSVVTVGAEPVFADVDEDSGNITADTIRPLIGPRTKAIMCVHIGGWPCDMDPILALAKEHDLRVIEDCAQAHGATYKGRSVGSMSDIAAWSFCQDKIITTGGEGGMTTTDDPELWSWMWSYKDHGKSWEAVYERQHPPGYRWVHESFGTNWRMLEMQAVIGRIQLARLPEWSAMRSRNAERIVEALRQHEVVRVPTPCKDVTHAWYRLYAYVRPERLAAGWDRDRVIQEIVALGVPCYQGTASEVYREKAFDSTSYRPAAPLPIAKKLGDTSLAFLVHPTLTSAEIDKTCIAINTVLERATR